MLGVHMQHNCPFSITAIFQSNKPVRTHLHELKALDVLHSTR